MTDTSIVTYKSVMIDRGGTSDRGDVTVELKSTSTRATWRIVYRGGATTVTDDLTSVEIDGGELEEVEVIFDVDGWQYRCPLVQIDGRLHALPPVVSGEPVLFRELRLMKKLGRPETHEAIRTDLGGSVIPALLPREWSDTIRDVPRPGARGRSLFELGVWMERYLEAWETDPARPMKVIEERFPYMNAATLNAMKDRARREGLFETRGRGKAGGRLTRKARELLAGRTDIEKTEVQ